ncbi:hypothetical protein [Pseudomonas sp. DP-17]|uniref:hypothetical protein n=1 Tax=Pseudomonas sp. DP-17 TaxID=1580486 RepID=UPI001EFB3C71|nr:hypothetical protein [Pseudomonas sp. DP-17]
MTNRSGAIPMECQFPQVRERLNGRRFVLAHLSPQSTEEQAVFSFSVEGDEIWGSFRGGKIGNGNVYGKARGPDSLELLYHCTTIDGEELAGWSRGKVKATPSGETILYMAWGWLSAATGGEEPTYIELNH